MSEKKSKKGTRSQGASPAGVKKTSVGGSSPLDLSLLEQMVKLMSANDLSVVDVRDGMKRVVLKRGPQAVTYAPTGSYAAPSYAPAATPAPAHAAPAASTSAASTPSADDTSGLVAIKSPMVGTYYSASSPEAKPFVSVGSTVDEETDVCIIEAMKVFNNIKAETRGTIAKVLVQNGQTVEFGQPLFWVKP